MRRAIILFLSFCLVTVLLAQDLRTETVSVASYSGSLKGLFNLLRTDESPFSFNYKEELLKKKYISIPKSTTLDQVLFQIKKQCAVDYNILGSSITFFAAKGFYIGGTVVDAASSERVPGAFLFLGEDTKSVSVDDFGDFSVFTYQDSLDLVIYHPNYQLTRRVIYPQTEKQFYIKLTPITSLSEVKVSSSDSFLIGSHYVNEIKPSSKPLTTLGGETDALAQIMLIPGVQNVSFGQQGLTIRGGSPDQNYVLIDGIPVYNTYHILGLFSIFNSSNISTIHLHKDAFPSKNTNRLSSVIDVNLKNGNKTKLSGEADIGLLSSGLFINGPIIKNKLSFSLSARRTYADLLGRLFIGGDNSIVLWSYDVMAKLHYQINEENEVSITGYNGGDQLNFGTRFSIQQETETEEETKGKLGWRNALVGARWKRIVNQRIIMELSTSVSTYNLRFSDEYSLSQDSISVFNSSSYRNGLNEWRAALDVGFFMSKNHKINTGLGMVSYGFSPFTRGYTSTTNNSSSTNSIASNFISGSEVYGFAEGSLYFTKGKVIYGTRITNFITSETSFVRLQPKFQLIRNIAKNKQIRISGQRTNQFVHLVPNNNLGLPVDIWLPVTKRLKPMEATQFSGRYLQKNKAWDFQVGGFVKLFNNILEHTAGAQLLSDESWENNLYVGSGVSYGIESALKYTWQKWNLYGSYTYGRSRRKVLGINEDQEYFTKYDRPHIANILVERKWEKNRLLASWSFASGNPITVPTARYRTFLGDEEIFAEEYGDINNLRLPSSHHLDISYIRDMQLKRVNASMVLGIHNIYNRLNPFMAFIGINDEGEPALKIRSLLPILPSFKYIVKF